MKNQTEKQAKKRLEYLRKELRAERISYGEIDELESLREYIEPGDVELLEAAGVPEVCENLTINPAAHTAGEWKQDGRSVFIPVYNDNAGAEKITLLLEKTQGEAEANARLIAAAPSMLAALQNLTEQCEWIPKETFTRTGLSAFKEAMKQAQAAIQKATA